MSRSHAAEPSLAAAEVAGQYRRHKECAQGGDDDVVHAFAAAVPADAVLNLLKFFDFARLCAFDKCHNSRSVCS